MRVRKWDRRMNLGNDLFGLWEPIIWIREFLAELKMWTEGSADNVLLQKGLNYW